MFKPIPMTKVRITGTKTAMGSVIDALYDLKIMHLVDFQKMDKVFLVIGVPFSQARDFSAELVKVNSVISYFERKDKKESALVGDFVKAKSRFEGIFRDFSAATLELSGLESRQAELKKQLSEPMGKIRIDKKYVREYSSIEMFSGVSKKPVGHLLENAGISFELSQEKSGETFAAVLFVPKNQSEKARQVLFSAGFSDQKLPENFSSEEFEKELFSVNEKIKKMGVFLERLGNENNGFLVGYQQALGELNTKAETPLRFGASENAFVATGWVPSAKAEALREKISRECKEKAHVEFSGTKKGAPTALDNPKPVKPFEFFLDLYTPPIYSELDPSLIVAFTFPLFFGFMLGDVGYGLVTLALFGFLALKAKGKLGSFAWVLVWSSISTIIFGLIFGEAFGYEFLEHPILNRVHEPAQVLGVAVLIGFLHINLGLLAGFYNELKNHGLKQAFFAKLSWLLLEAGIILLALDSLAILSIGFLPGAIIALCSIAMIYLGEGPKGLVELPAILSNMLSYARLFAVGLSSASLALVINQMAGALWSSGIIGMIGAVIILVIGHVLNIALGILGPSLHSLRLHYVEFFSKFFHGGGEKYKPFGQIYE